MSSHPTVCSHGQIAIQCFSLWWCFPVQRPGVGSVGGELTISVISAMSSLCSQLGNMLVNVKGSNPA